MRICISIFLAIFFLYSSSVNAQTDIKIRKKDFKKEKAGFKEAWGHVQSGDEYFEKKGSWYGKAYDEYLLALVYNHTNAELNYKTGVSALYSDHKEEAADFLLKSVEQKSDVAKDVLMLTGRALQYSGMYSPAINNLELYLKSTGRKPAGNVQHAEKWLEECKSALIITSDTLNIFIQNLGPVINSGMDDYSPVVTSDGKQLFFASRRMTFKSEESDDNSGSDENIFISVSDSGNWNLPVNAGKALNSKYPETPLFINQTNDRLYLYEGHEEGGNIMVSELNRKSKWKKPANLAYRINTSGSESSIAFSPDGNSIYFVTDNSKKGSGGKDICFIVRKGKKRWSAPKNAGPIINTEYDEESISFSKGGDTLWFSSRGHNTMGGFDIFYTTRNSEGTWDSVKNAGYPVNTPWDELFYSASQNGNSFNFVSNRSGGFGGLDLYTGTRISSQIIDSVSVPDTIITPAADSIIISSPDTVLTNDSTLSDFMILRNVTGKKDHEIIELYNISGYLSQITTEFILPAEIQAGKKNKKLTI